MIEKLVIDYFCNEFDLATTLVTGLLVAPGTEMDSREMMGSLDRSRSLMLMVLTGSLTELDPAPGSFFIREANVRTGYTILLSPPPADIVLYTTFSGVDLTGWKITELEDDLVLE